MDERVSVTKMDATPSRRLRGRVAWLSIGLLATAASGVAADATAPQDPPPTAPKEAEAAAAPGAENQELVLRIRPLPEADTSALEPAVQEQLAEVGRALEQAWPALRDGARTLGDAFGALALHYHAYGLTEPARAAYRNAEALSADLRWPYYLAELDAEQGDLDAAIARYQAVLAGHPGDLAVLVRLGEAAATANRLEEARQAFEHARAIAPDEPAVLVGLGQVALAAGDAREAVALLGKALELQPAATRIHHPLGLAYRELGDLERARAHLEARGDVGIKVADPRQQALEALVTGERILLLRGRKAFAAGRWAEAAEAFRQAADSDPASARARVNLGAALGQLGDRDGAIAAFEEALDLEADNGTAHFNLGLLLADRDLRRAIDHLQRALSFAPTDGDIHRELARLLRRAGRVEEAIGAYRNAIRARGEDEAAHLGLAAVLVDLGRYREAVEALDIANALLPREGRIAIAFARLLAAGPDPLVRDGERALQLAMSVFDAAPTAEHAELVAMALGELDRCEEAAQWQGRALEALGESPEPARAEAARRLTHYQAGSPCRPPYSSQS